MLRNLIQIENNIFLYIIKDKIVMADFLDLEFKAIDSNSIESNKYYSFVIEKYSNQIYYLFSK